MRSRQAFVHSVNVGVFVVAVVQLSWHQPATRHARWPYGLTVAQATSEERPGLWVVHGKDRKMGLMDRDGHVVLRPQYKEARRSSEGISAVKDGELWGYVDARGQFVIAPVFTEVTDFSEGLAAARRSGSAWGYIDANGNEMIEPQFKQATRFSNGIAWVRTNDGWGAIDRTGTFSIPAGRFRPGGDFAEGLAPVWNGGSWAVGDGWGYVDARGNMIIAPRFEMAGPFSEGLAPVIDKGQLGYIDKSGRFAVKPYVAWSSERQVSSKIEAQHQVMYGNGEWTPVLPAFSEGKAATPVGDLWGYIDRNGKWIIQPQYKSAGPFSEGVANVETAGMVGYIDERNTYVIEPKFEIAYPFKDGIARTIVQRPYVAYIDHAGDFVWQPQSILTGEFAGVGFPEAGTRRVDARPSGKRKITVPRSEDLRSGEADSSAVARMRQRLQGDFDQTWLEHYRNGDYASALPSAEQALELRKKLYGPNHADVAAQSIWVARILTASGDREAGRKRYLEALEIYENNAPTSQEMVVVLDELALMLFEDAVESRNRDTLDETIGLMERKKSIQEKLVGSDDPSLEETRQRLARAVALRKTF